MSSCPASGQERLRHGPGALPTPCSANLAQAREEESSEKIFGGKGRNRSLGGKRRETILGGEREEKML